MLRWPWGNRRLGCFAADARPALARANRRHSVTDGLLVRSLKSRFTTALGRCVTAALAASLFSCASDPCAGVLTSCLSLHLQSTQATRVDRLRLFLRVNDKLSPERISMSPSGREQDLPLSLQILLDASGGQAHVSVLAERAGAPVLAGQGTETVAPAEHKRLTLDLTEDLSGFALPAPPPRHSAAMAYFPERKSVVLFGGIGSAGQPLDDTWEYLSATSQWSQLDILGGPSARGAHAMTYHARRRAVVLFGGLTADNQAQHDLWILTAQGRWSRLATPVEPPPRGYASLAYDSQQDTLFLFGGRSTISALDPPLLDLWQLAADDTAWSAVSILNTVPKLVTPQLFYDGASLHLVGANEAELLPRPVRHWLLMGKPVTLQEVVPMPGTEPSYRSGAAGAFDDSSGRFWLLGGQASQGLLSDAYALTVATGAWSKLATLTPQPPARSGAALAYNRAVPSLVYVGGQDGAASLLPDNWTYQIQSSTWQSLPGMTP